MNSEHKKKTLDKLVWKYTFLPGTKELEIEFRECVENDITFLLRR